MYNINQVRWVAEITAEVGNIVSADHHAAIDAPVIAPSSNCEADIVHSIQCTYLMTAHLNFLGSITKIDEREKKANFSLNDLFIWWK